MIPGGKNIACMVIAERGSLRRQGGDGGDTPEVSVGVSQWSRWGKGVSPAEGTTGAEAHRGDSAVRANRVPALCWVQGHLCWPSRGSLAKNTHSDPGAFSPSKASASDPAALECGSWHQSGSALLSGSGKAAWSLGDWPGSAWGNTGDHLSYCPVWTFSSGGEGGVHMSM